MDNTPIPTSRFERLAPELRNRIYELVLGSQVLHVGLLVEFAPNDVVRYGPSQNTRIYDPTESKEMQGLLRYHDPTICKLSVCQAKVTDQEAADEREVQIETLAGKGLAFNFMQDATPELAYVDCTRRHKVCRRNIRLGTQPIDLSLLFVCKTTYHEAALLPFTLNTFTFGHPHTLHAFLSKLSEPQRSAINQMLFYSPSRRGGFRPPLLPSMSQLIPIGCHLTLHFEFSTYEVYRRTSTLYGPGACLAEGLGQLSTCSLATLRVDLVDLSIGEKIGGERHPAFMARVMAKRPSPRLETWANEIKSFLGMDESNQGASS
ncbi:hypothetical protein LTR27_009102 [Elasticomyces elasticus]|nr:hypothetical protein LTR27_009102 [Elasticomyces elasticus]